MRLLHFFLAVFFVSSSVFSQEEKIKPIALSVDMFYGSIIEHNPEIRHLITGHPTGLVLSYNNKTFGKEEWERRYNYPDWGFSAVYQNMHNSDLGNVYGLYGHINWYFLKRHLVIGVGQGVGYASSPYNYHTNYNNIAYGSHLMSATYLRGNLVWENIWEGLGVQAGVSIFHYSNGSFKSPNKSTNTFAYNIGINYQLDYDKFPEYNHQLDSLSSTYAQPIHYTIEFRSGVNESGIIGIGQKPFYVISAYADKRINYKSTFQAGVDIFFSNSLKEHIRYRSIAYPEDGLTGKEDYKRVGIFLGHELRFNKVSAITQLGYYAYWPYDFEGRVYNRLGLKRYLYEEKIFASVSVKSHWAKAEAVEFGVGYRL